MNNNQAIIAEEKELQISDLFRNLFKYKFISLFSIVVPLVIVCVYLINREQIFEAEITINANNKITSSLIFESDEFQAPYLKLFDSLGRDDVIIYTSDDIFLSYLDLVREVDNKFLENKNSLNNYKGNFFVQTIRVEKNKKLNEAFVFIKYDDENEIRNVLSLILNEADKLNKKILTNNLARQLDYILKLKDSAKERHVEQIELTKERLENKIFYLKKLQESKIDLVIQKIEENIELAEIAGIKDPMYPELNSLTYNENIFLTWKTEPERLLDGSNEGSLGDRKMDEITIPSSQGFEYSNLLLSGVPLFYFGSDLLKSELSIISARADNDSLTPGLSELKIELENLNSRKESSYIVYLEYLNDYEKYLQTQLMVMENILDEDVSRSVIYNTDKIKVSNATINAAFLIFLGLIFGLVLSFILTTAVSFASKIK